MKEKRHLEVLFETHEITTISFKRNHAIAVFCRLCRAKTVHLTVSEAASISNFSETAISRLVETDQIHSIEAASGWLLVCGNSLSALAKGRS